MSKTIYYYILLFFVKFCIAVCDSPIELNAFITPENEILIFDYQNKDMIVLEIYQKDEFNNYQQKSSINLTNLKVIL